MSSFNGYIPKYEDINGSKIVGGDIKGSIVNVKDLPTTHVGIGVDTTLTAAIVLVGYAQIDGAAADVLTFPSAATLVAAVSEDGKKIAVGDTIFFTVTNGGATDSGAVLAGTGGTVVGSGVVAANSSKVLAIRFTNVTASSETYDLIA